MRIMADNDVLGAVAVIRRMLNDDEWHDLAELVEIEFVEFADFGLNASAPDRSVWQTCQQNEVLLITGNRTGGTDSLDAVMRELGAANDLPVTTIADPKRVLRDREYSESCTEALLDYVEIIEQLRGARRLFIP